MEGSPNAPPDEDLWGEVKGSYTFKDLGSFMEEQDMKVKKKKKGKGGKDDKDDKDDKDEKDEGGSKKAGDKKKKKKMQVNT